MYSVLIVDEDLELRHAAAAWTEEYGYVVHEVSDAEEAIAAAETEAYDIALCDASVAGRDGVWLAW